MNIYLGNLSIEQIEREYSVVFTEEDKKWLQEHHQDEASNIQSGKWHFFDIPRIMMAGSNEFAKEIRYICKIFVSRTIQNSVVKKGEEE